jgi:hypothetical protein
VGLERGPLSLVRINEKLLENCRPWGILRADHATPLYPQKLALNFAESGGRSVGIVHLRTKGRGVWLLFGTPVNVLYDNDRAKLLKYTLYAKC